MHSYSSLLKLSLHMKQQQIILVSSAFVLLVLLYFWGNTVAPKRNINVQQNTINNISSFNIQEYIDKTKKQLSSSKIIELQKLEDAFGKNDPSAKQIISYTKLARFWKDSIRLFEPYAYYTTVSAKLENSEKSLTFAAHLLLDNLQYEADEAKKTWMANEAKQLFEKALVIDPSNDSLSIGFGACFIYGSTVNKPEEAMQGIQRILAVVRKDSANMYAQFMLGMGGLVSKQYNKAIDRFITVIKHEPNNIEAMLNLAEAYELYGDKGNAIKWYTICQNLIKVPEVKKELIQRINELKKK